MSVSTIDGKVIEAPIKVQRKAFARFAHIMFEQPDGRTRPVSKVLASKEIADLVTPGAEGRFYMFKTIDVAGIAGVRLADGTAKFAYPGSNLAVFAILILTSTAWMALRVFIDGDVPLLGLPLLGLGIFGYVSTRNNRASARRQFDADSGPDMSSLPASAATAPAD